METILITGGAGFIGSNFVLDWCSTEDSQLVNLDKLTYAGNLQNLESLKDERSHVFVLGDIGDRSLVRELLERYQPSAVVHFAAESHVDRSIRGPEEFITTNVLGTFRLIDEVRSWWAALNENRRDRFRFLHVSTDEVYGSLSFDAPAFSETTAYAPNSPYSASKAAADHLVRAYHHTYGLPTLTTNCSNNYGPYQFPEKLVPLVLLKALAGEPIPVYGDGSNVRDWLYVRDHCSALKTILRDGRPGETYNIGGESERTNLQVVQTLCDILDELIPGETKRSELVRFVTDRPGHDRRYAVDASKLRNELGWAPSRSFDQGLLETVQWYLSHRDWLKAVRTGSYKQWMILNYDQREIPCEV